MLTKRFGIVQLILGVWGILVALVFAIWLWNYAREPRITVNTSNASNYVKIEQAPSESAKDRPFAQQAQHSVSARVKPGSYTLSVYDRQGNNGVSKTVSVHSGQHLTITLNPVVAAAAEPVYGSYAAAVSVSQSQLRFLDITSGKLMQVGQDGSLNNLFADRTFQGVSWSGSGIGVAQEKSGALDLIQNNALSLLNAPLHPQANNPISYGVSIDQTVYASDGQSAYIAKAGRNDFKKIYSSNQRISQISAGNQGRVALVEHPPQQKGSEPPGKVVVIDAAGKLHKAPEEGATISWSPDGSRLLLSEEVENIVFDPALRQLKKLAVPQARNFTWRTNDSLLYSIDNQLWLYELGSGKGAKISGLVNGETITAIYPNQDGSFVYFTADNGEKQQLFRVNLNSVNGPAHEDRLAALPVFLPETTDNSCVLNYLVFNQPTILVYYPGQQQPQICIDTAKKELRYYDIDPSTLRFAAYPASYSD